MTTIIPLIICGGSGTRLWPLSRSQSPKQFQRVGGPETPTFFQSALQRHRGPHYGEAVVVTGAAHRATVLQQLREIQTDARVICEPVSRNTGPAVLAAAMLVARDDPDAVLLVVPSDHVIDGSLTETVADCVPGALAGHIVTFGITPRYPEPGFGYILEDGPLQTAPDGPQKTDGAGASTGLAPAPGPLYRVGGFVEKPQAAQAAGLIDTGRAYWASGLSLFTARTIMQEYRRHDPATASAVARAVDEGAQVPGTYYLSDAPFAEALAQPTETAVFERTDRIAMAHLPVTWDDVGSWRAMYAISAQDRDGNVLQGDVIARGSRNSMVRSESRLVSVVGLEDVVVIDTPDALLVAQMDDTQEVRSIVDELKRRARPEAERHAEPRPTMVSAAPSHRLEEVLQTDRYHLGTAEIAPGRSLDLEQGPVTRQVILVRGTLDAIGPRWRRSVAEGGRVYADPEGPVRMVNSGDCSAELLYLSLEGLYEMQLEAEAPPVAPRKDHG